MWTTTGYLWDSLIWGKFNNFIARIIDDFKYLTWINNKIPFDCRININIFTGRLLFILLVSDINFIFINYFKSLDLIFRFKLDMIFQSIELRVHSPNINLVGWSCHCECITDLNRLYGIVLTKSIFNDPKIIQRPTIVRITNVKIYKSLKINHKVYYWEFVLKFCQILFVLEFNCVFLLILLKFIKIRLYSAILVFYFFKVKLVCFVEHVFRSLFLEIVFTPSPLNSYRSLLKH